MKQILIISAKLTNFMGVRHYETTFNTDTNEFRGDNGTGKTTLATSFFWVLWGKNLVGYSDTKFQPKPLDSENQTDRNTTTEVEFKLCVDGELINIRRTYREKWGTTRGESEEKYVGNETCRYWNDVLKQEKEFNRLVSEEICDENIFRLITDPVYFLSQKAQDQRRFLMNLAGNVTPEMICAIHPEFASVVKELSATKTITDYRKQIETQIKNLKTDVQMIPARIDECNRNMPEEEDWNLLIGEQKRLELKAKQIADSLFSYTQSANAMADERKQKANQLYSLQNQAQTLERTRQDEANKEYYASVKKNNDTKFQIQRFTLEVDSKKERIEGINARLAEFTDMRTALLEERTKIKARTLEFTEGQFECPTCHRRYEDADVEQMKATLTENFNQETSTLIENNTKQGLAVKANREKLEAERETLMTQQRDMEKQIALLQMSIVDVSAPEAVDMSHDIEYITLQKQIEALKAELTNPVETTDEVANELRTQQKEVADAISSLSVRLSVRQVIQNTQKRINELEGQYSSLHAEIVRLKGIDDLIKAYQKAYMTAVEDNVNAMFTYIKFKLYEKQINEGEKECCEALVNGVPYSTNLNSAARVNAGMDFVSAVQKKYDVSAPVWIDNAETVCQLLVPDCQIVKLVVDEDFKTLTKTV